MSTTLPSYRSQLRWPLGLFVTGFALVMVLFVDMVVSRTLRDAQAGQVERAARHMSDRLDEDMAHAMQDLAMSANAREIKDAASGDGIGRAQAWLERLKGRFPRQAWLGVTDRSGRLVAATDGIAPGTDMSRQPWFEQGRVGRVALDVHRDALPQGGIPPDGGEQARFVDLAAPISDAEGHFAGVISAHLNWTWAERLQRSILRSIDRLDRTEMLVVSRTGEVLIGSGPIDRRGLDETDGAAGYVSSTVAAQGPRQQGLGWTVIARQPLDAALSPVRDVRLSALAGALFIVMIFVGIAGQLARSIAKPFEDLARATDESADRPAGPLASLTPSTVEAAKVTESLRTAFASVQAQDLELRHLSADIERTVEERTAELQRAKDEAEAATAAKGEFLATVSHEIRSPLGSIVGLTDLLLDDKAIDGRQRRRLELVQAAGAGLTALVNDILDLSKFGSDSFRLDEKPFQLDKMAATCTAIMKAQADQKGVAMRLDLDPDLPFAVLADEHRLRQVLINLIGNAVKFTRCGEVTLRVARTGVGGADGRILFQVVDTGIGIPAEKIGTLFRRYAQADASIRNTFGGTGLGLAISQRLVQLMGGEITIESEEGRGSTFGFSLDLAAAALPDGSATEPQQAVARPLRILLAEDLLANQEIVAAMVHAAGHTVDVVGDGHAAVRAASTIAYDIVLLDIQMPGLDGIEVARQIRSGTAPDAGVPIVALTANVLPEQVRRFTQAGIDAHVAKPIVRRDLIAAIEAAMVRSGEGDRSQAAPVGGSTVGDAFARTSFDEILTLLGPAKTEGYLSDLSRIIDRSWQVPTTSEAGRIEDAAHKIVGLAGMLGFGRLSERCRDLEYACDQGGDVAGLLAAVADESSAALRQAARLMEECRTATVSTDLPTRTEASRS